MSAPFTTNPPTPVRINTYMKDGLLLLEIVESLNDVDVPNAQIVLDMDETYRVREMMRCYFCKQAKHCAQHGPPEK